MERINSEQVVIGVDLDGVCADFYGRMREIAAEWLEVPLNTLSQSPSYWLKEWGIQDYETLHRFAVTQRKLFETCGVVPGARRILRQLSDEKYRIRINTHRLFISFFHATAANQTISWLDASGLPYWDLCFMKDKTQVGAHVYVDDTPHNILSLRKQDLFAVCFANSTNTDIKDPRAANWDEVYKLIHERHPNSELGHRRRSSIGVSAIAAKAIPIATRGEHVVRRAFRKADKRPKSSASNDSRNSKS